jgi:hypothetical protein
VAVEGEEVQDKVLVIDLTLLKAPSTYYPDEHDRKETKKEKVHFPQHQNSTSKARRGNFS